MELRFEQLTEQQKRRIAEEIVDSQREYLVKFVELINCNITNSSQLTEVLFALVDKMHACRDWQVGMLQAEQAEHDPRTPRPCIAIPQPRRIRPIAQIPLNAVLVQSSGPAMEIDAMEPFETM